VGRIEPEVLGDLADGPLATTQVATWTTADLGAMPILDVRDAVEHADGVLPGATLVHFADFAQSPNLFVGEDVLIHCQSGYRASVAAGFAEAAGANVTVLVDDLKNCGVPLVKPGD
jgi:rhodanese-related sulfurtransferase